MEPKFVAICEIIIKKIRSGELLPGDKVPSENELISNYKISNTTARKCLLLIEHKGYARRIKGKGTFVLNRTAEHQLVRTLGSINSTRKGFNESLEAEGFRPKNVIIEKTILNDGISSEITGKHYIIDGPVLMIRQLRYADDILMKNETRYISLTLCPKIDRLSSDISFYKSYEDQYKLKITDVKQTLSVDIFDDATALAAFEVQKQIPAFVLDSAIICDNEKVVEIERSFYRGDKYKFAIDAHPEYNLNYDFNITDRTSK